MLRAMTIARTTPAILAVALLAGCPFVSPKDPGCQPDDQAGGCKPMTQETETGEAETGAPDAEHQAPSAWLADLPHEMESSETTGTETGEAETGTETGDCAPDPAVGETGC